MRLNSIKLSGFKSFAEPTNFMLPGQLVGVVGPNGCGKSNIMDAVRWVLGESKASELRGALTRALETEGPVLVDVVTAREELSMPPTITAAQIKGFTVWALKTVLSGRGDELLDLADTNVWRRLFKGSSSEE